MSDNRDGKFVVPKRPGAGSGWWIGQVVEKRSPSQGLNGKKRTLCSVNQLWAEHAQDGFGPVFLADAGDLTEVESPTEAMDLLRSKGVEVDAD